MQCGLSGNRVSRVGDGAARPSKGNHLTGNGRRDAGKADPTKAAGLPRFAAAFQLPKNASIFWKRFRCASRTPKAHGRFAQSVFSDARVVRKNKSNSFAARGRRIFIWFMCYFPKKLSENYVTACMSRILYAKRNSLSITFRLQNSLRRLKPQAFVIRISC